MSEDDHVEELLTPDEVCRVLRISPAKFYRLVTSGRLPAVKIGSTWRVRPSALSKWIGEQSDKAGLDTDEKEGGSGLTKE